MAVEKLADPEAMAPPGGGPDGCAVAQVLAQKGKVILERRLLQLTTNLVKKPGARCRVCH